MLNIYFDYDDDVVITY